MSAPKRLPITLLGYLLALTPLTHKGALAKIDGLPSIVSSDPEVLEITVNPDGFTATVATHKPGPAIISVSGDADLGDGVETISKTFDIEVYDPADEAADWDLTLTPVAAVEQPTGAADSGGQPEQAAA